MNQDEIHYKKRLTKQQGRLKAEHFCAYQERCQLEVRDKLYSWGLFSNEVEEIIADLISDNFLNEERFALAYVAGKFRMKSWGKRKIKQGLAQKKVSERLIRDAMNSIDAADYYHTLFQLLEKKAALLAEKDGYKRKAKLAQYAVGKGYENDLIFDILNNNNL